MADVQDQVQVYLTHILLRTCSRSENLFVLYSIGWLSSTIISSKHYNYRLYGKMPLNYEALLVSCFLIFLPFCLFHNSFCILITGWGQKAVTLTWEIYFVSPISFRKRDWHRSASRSPGKSMKSNIWGTTGKEERNRRAEGALPSGTPPPVFWYHLHLHLGGHLQSATLPGEYIMELQREQTKENTHCFKRARRIKTERIC